MGQAHFNLFKMDSKQLKETLASIKHDFFAYRNGMVSDALKKAGSPHKLSYGLQLPQLSEIAKKLPSDMALAEKLWQDKDTRESRLLSFFLFPKELVGMKKAKELIEDLQTREEAEILVFRLFRHLPFTLSLSETIKKSNPDNPIISYCHELVSKSFNS